MNEQIDFFAAMTEQCEKFANYSDVMYVRTELATSGCKCYVQLFKSLRSDKLVRGYSTPLEYLASQLRTEQDATEILKMCLHFNCCKLHTAAIMHEILPSARFNIPNRGIPQ